MTQKNKELVLQAFDTLFNKRDYQKDEATKQQSRSGMPMFGTTFPS